MRISNLSRKAVLFVFLLTVTVAQGAERVKKAKSDEPVKQQTEKQENKIKSNQVLATENLMINYKSDIITLSYVNKSMEETMFKITDNSGLTVYRMKPSSEFIVHERLVTSKLPEGKYRAKFIVGDEEFSKSIYVMR